MTQGGTKLRDRGEKRLRSVINWSGKLDLTTLRRELSPEPASLAPAEGASPLARSP